MPHLITIHFDNTANLSDPHLWVWYDGIDITHDVPPMGHDEYGLIYEIEVLQSRFHFKFKQGEGTEGPWEDDSLNRSYFPQKMNATLFPGKIWCKGDKAFIYDVLPKKPETDTAEQFLLQLDFKSGMYVTGTGGFSGLGATLLNDGRVLFGLYHPNAARVYVMGSFNNWQRPGHANEDPQQFIESKLYRGYFGLPNIWLAVTDNAVLGDEYKFYIQGGVPRDQA